MADPTEPTVRRPPLTGQPAIDAALAAVADLSAADLDEHPARLAAAHAVVLAGLDAATAEVATARPVQGDGA
jgi:hypothetical protein